MEAEEDFDFQRENGSRVHRAVCTLSILSERTSLMQIMYNTVDIYDSSKKERAHMYRINRKSMS